MMTNSMLWPAQEEQMMQDDEHNTYQNNPQDHRLPHFYSEPAGQPEGFRFYDQTSGGGRISNVMQGKFGNFYAETARGQFGISSGPNDRTRGGINSLYPVYKSWPYDVHGSSSDVKETLGGHNQNNYGAHASRKSAMITISDVKVALEPNTFTRKQENMYSFEYTGVGGVLNGYTSSSLYPTATNNQTFDLIGCSTVHATGHSSSAKHTLNGHCNSRIATALSARNSIYGISTGGINDANYVSDGMYMEHSAAWNNLTDGSGINWSIHGAIQQGPLSRSSNHFGMEISSLPYYNADTPGTGNSNMSNYCSVFGSREIISTNILPQHTVIPQSSEYSVATNILQSSAIDIVKELSTVALPDIGNVVMADPPIDDIDIGTELDIDDFILVEPTEDFDAPPKTLGMNG